MLNHSAAQIWELANISGTLNPSFRKKFITLAVGTPQIIPQNRFILKPEFCIEYTSSLPHFGKHALFPENAFSFN